MAVLKPVVVDANILFSALLRMALTIHLDGLLWSGDEKLKQGLISQGFDHFFTVD